MAIIQLTPAMTESEERATQSSNNSYLSMASSLPITSIIWIPISTVPTGFKECNGQALLIATYPDLTAAFYCGDANNATALYGYKCTSTAKTSRSTSGTYIVLPDLRGEFIRAWDDARGIDAGRGLGSAQADDFKSHNHTFPVYSVGASSGPNTASNSNTGLWCNVSTTATGGSETRPRNIALMPIIKVTGFLDSSVAFYTKAQIDTLLASKVDYTGATSDLDIGTHKIAFDNADWTGGNVIYVPLTKINKTQTEILNEAITNAIEGDTLILASGIYTIDGTVLVDKQIGIVGTGTEIKLNSASVNEIIKITSYGVSVSDIKITTEGAKPSCYCITVTKGLNGISLKSLNITVNVTAGGSAIRINDSSVDISDCKITVMGIDGVYFYTDNESTNEATINVSNCVINSTNSINSLKCGILVSTVSSTHNLIANIYNCSVCANFAALGATNDPSSKVLINVYNSLLNGGTKDVKVTGTNVINLYGCILVNNTTLGTTPYLNFLGTSSSDGVGLDLKADKQTIDGGFAGGSNSTAYNGFAGGSNSSANAGGAVGSTSSANAGGAVGSNSIAYNGGAVGSSAGTSNGFAGGADALTMDEVYNLIDAIQLGTGTNSTPNTLQIYGNQLLDANGKIPVARFRDRIAVDYTVTNPTPTSMLATQVMNNGSGKISIGLTGHGYANGNVLELSGAIPTGIAKINNVNFPLVHNNAYVYVMNVTTNTFEISATIDGLAIAYTDGGTDGWTLVRPANSSLVFSSLDFNADGGEWDITISGTIINTKIRSESNSFRLNGVSATVYYSSNLAAFAINPYNYFYVGGNTAKNFYDYTIGINIKRLSETSVSVFARNVGLATQSFADTPTVVNTNYGGRAVNASFANLTSFTFYPSVNYGGAFASGTKVIIRRGN